MRLHETTLTSQGMLGNCHLTAKLPPRLTMRTGVDTPESEAQLLIPDDAELATVRFSNGAI